MISISIIVPALCLLGTAQEPNATPSSPPQATDTAEVAQLRKVVTDLQHEVDELKSADDDRWLTQQRAEEIRGLVQDVLADADTRASLLQSGAVAGYDKGFFIGSTDGNYLLRLGGQLQVRAVYNLQDDGPADDNRFGFELRRTKLDFRGNIVDATWQYYIELEASRSSGIVSLSENGWIQKDLGNGWKIRTGQFKPMYLREESVSSRRLLAVERSQVNAQFTAGTAQGVQGAYETDRWRAFAAFIDGINTPGTAFSAEDTELAFTGRGEFLIMGDWKSIEDDDGWRGDKPALMLGGGFTWQRQEFGTGSNLPLPDFNNAEVENLGFTADLTWKMNGFSAGGAVVYRHLETDTGLPTDIDLDQVAFVLRGGVFVADDIEIYALYEWGDLDISGIDDLSTLTVGVTKFWDRHNLKWQNDIGFGFNSVASQWAVDSAGWRADVPGEDGQIVIRSQMQLLF